jgi:hypothetical protein
MGFEASLRDNGKLSIIGEPLLASFSCAVLVAVSQLRRGSSGTWYLLTITCSSVQPTICGKRR